jgi:2-amino-4-hydroxy-6-hydroxymethyldihydropteridine diphosphokinase
LTAAVLGLGGNIGDRRKLIASALQELAAHPEIRVKAVSALYETLPWGKTDQAPFLNAAALAETTLTPRGLLDAILGVERQLGRHRGEKWGPRIIDIDILLFGTGTIEEQGLHIPHPHLHERAFALKPLIDVVPDAEFAGRRADAWLAQADQAGMRRVGDAGWHLEGRASTRFP